MTAAETGAQIAAARKGLGMTQKQLAEQLHVTDKAVSKWERGLNFPDLALLEPLAGQLNMTVPKLLGVEEAPPEQAVAAVTELSLQELLIVKRRMTARAWFTIILAVGVWTSQIAASWFFDQAGIYGLPMVLTMGIQWIPGIIIGNALYSLKLLRRIR